MKKTAIIFFAILSTFSCIAQDYFWSANKKFYMSRSKKEFIIKMDSPIHLWLKKIEIVSAQHIVYSNNTAKIYLKPELDSSILRGYFEEYVPIMHISNIELIPTGEILLKPRTGISINEIISIAPDVISVKGYSKYNTFVMNVTDWNLLFHTANSIYESGMVEYCHPNFIAPIERFSINDPLYPAQWNLNHSGDIDINAPEAWNIANSLHTIRIAVIDDGCEDHHDLVGKVLPGYTAKVTSTRPSIDGRPCETPIPQHLVIPDKPNFAHGMACAGIIAANHNNIDIRGILNNSLIVPINIFNAWYYNGARIAWEETPLDIANAINKAWDDFGCDVLSNSWCMMPAEDGTIVEFDEIRNAIQNAVLFGRSGKGCVVVFSSGNYHASANGVCCFPANMEEVISVGAVNYAGEVYSYSNRGEALDVVAPVAVQTLDRMGELGNNLSNTQPSFNGTSAACPQVSGVAALILSENPELTSSQVAQIIKMTARKLGNNNYGYYPNHPYGLWCTEVGYGVVDAYRALLMTQHGDVYLRDNTADNGCEPNETITQYNSSPDIWLTDQNGNTVTEPAVGQTYTVHVRVSNRSAIPSTSATLTLSWGISKTGYNSNNGRLVCPSVCNQTARGTVAVDFPLGTIAAGATAERTFTWTVPDPSTLTCSVNPADPWHVAFMACINDGNPTPGLSDGTIAADQQARLSNNVAWHSYPLEFNGLIIIIDEPLIPIFGAPASLTGGSSEADAELTWRAADGSVLGTGETLTIVPSATTERYVLEGYSPSLDAYGRDTLTLHPRLGAILTVAPNPVAGGQTEVSLRLATTLGSATLQVVNNLGQAILTQPVAPMADGSATATLNLQGVPSGQYQLRLMAGTTLVDIHTLVVR